jgi:hypothetical protein
MPKLRIALLPSLQDTNKFTDYTGKATHEMAQLAVFADKLLARLNANYGYAEIEAKIFSGLPYSKNTTNLQGLIAQERQAYAWLNAVSYPTLAFNLHTDSGTFSHVGAYWDGAASGSETLALLIRSLIAPVFNTTRVLGADYGAQGYVFTNEMHHKHRPVLIEIGSHQNAVDERTIAEKSTEIIDAMIKAIISNFKLPSAPPVEPPAPPVVDPILAKTGDGLKKYYEENAGAKGFGKPMFQCFHAYGEILISATTPKHPSGQYHEWRNAVPGQVITYCWCHPPTIT